MPNGNSGSAIKGALELIAKAVGSGAKTRKDLLSSASDFAGAVQMASALCTTRLARALAAGTPGEKHQILAQLTTNEIEQMGKVNQLCGPIGAAATELHHALSNEWLNVNLGAHAEAQSVFQLLLGREQGLQQLFNLTLVPPVSDTDLDKWLRERVAELLEIATAATGALTALARSI